MTGAARVCFGTTPALSLKSLVLPTATWEYLLTDLVIVLTFPQEMDFSTLPDLADFGIRDTDLSYYTPDWIGALSDTELEIDLYDAGDPVVNPACEFTPGVNPLLTADGKEYQAWSDLEALPGISKSLVTFLSQKEDKPEI